MKIKYRVNDQVKISTGKDKGKTGKIIQVLKDSNKVVVDGVNVMYKHLKPRRSNEKGQRVQFNGPISVANIILLCPKCGNTSRIAYKLSVGKGEQADKKIKSRICKKCSEVID
jgi:large subunit ribosomal protein L24